MVALWVVIGLIISASSVSLLGAAFSIDGLGALFSGAALAVSIMAGCLELSKFVLAAYLHQRWNHLNFIFKTYLVSAIVVLSAITSMGIFGFLSNAYQSASSTLEAEEIKLAALKTQKDRHNFEIQRLNKSVDEIPATRVSARLRLRSEIEPEITALNKKIEQVEQQVNTANLNIHAIKQKVGPLIYIARVFKVEIDTIVKYLIFLFVFVFDPLAICLVIATSEAMEARKHKHAVPVQARKEENAAAEPAVASEAAPPLVEEAIGPEDEMVQMRFTDGDSEQKTTG